MSGSKALISSGWSTLSTVENFDVGVSNDNKIIATTDDISKTVVKSLFVESLLDQLCKMFEKDPNKRNKLYQGICRKLYKMQLIESTYCIEELAPLRGFYQQALLDIIAPDTRFCSLPYLKFGTSRYTSEYDEIGFIASGGFGKVFKARNRLDQVIYAVKKIPLKYQSIATFEIKLNEVKTLAKLNHNNIVQYKAAWLEPIFDMTSSIQPSEEINFSSSDSDIVVFQHNQSSPKNISNHFSQNENDNNAALCKYSGKSNVVKNIPRVTALLYVTMQLCDQTLGEWMLKRNLSKTVNKSLALYIMTEATSGVQYIHSCNIVHHDIKPCNIFLSSDLKSVEVGDFGLSCLQGHDHSSCPLEGGQFGTPLYAAPEQLKGCCDSKSDMFSLGLILIELFTAFSTEMERVKILTKARAGVLPPSIPLHLESITKDLLSHKPNKRPTATELITVLKNMQQHELNKTILKLSEENDTENKSQLCSKINYSLSIVEEEKDEIIKNKDNEIKELRRILAQREDEIAYLKKLITHSSS